MYEALSAMASVMLDPYLLLLIFVTTIGGIVIGVLPGLGATTGAALLLPFTLTMSPVHAIAVLATLYVSATFAGSITAILINTPGTWRQRPPPLTAFRLPSAVRLAGRSALPLLPAPLAVFSRLSCCVLPRPCWRVLPTNSDRRNILP